MSKSVVEKVRKIVIVTVDGVFPWNGLSASVARCPWRIARRVNHIFFKAGEQGIEVVVAVAVAVDVEHPGGASPVFTCRQTVFIVAVAERTLRDIILGKLGAGEAED
ncbi:MAG TPA: hypothetical protein VFS83_18150 [Ktedonobacterales bacterium]|nr:hypothetical protein [Ktedonobacterales bacterium]